MTSKIVHLSDPEASDVDTAPVVGVPPEVDNVQEFLEYLLTLSNVSASPGFTWGKTGTTTKGTYLLNDSVPSNVTGRVMPITGDIVEVFAAVKTAGTYTFSIERRVGVVFTEILQFTMTGVRTYEAVVSVPVTKLDELAVLVRSTSSANPSDPVVGLIVKGSYT
jgi:hypothetical protein